MDTDLLPATQIFNKQQNENSYNSQQNLNNSNQKNQNSVQKQGPVQLLDMAIDLGNNQVRNIQVYENQRPIDVAIKFCQDNELTEEAIEILAENINQNLQAVQLELQQKQQQEQQERIQQTLNKMQIAEQEQEQQNDVQVNQFQPQSQQFNSNMQRNSDIKTQQYEQNVNQNVYPNANVVQKNSQSNTKSYDNQNHQFQPTFDLQVQEFIDSFGDVNKKQKKGNNNVHEKLYQDAQMKKIRQENKTQNIKQSYNEKHKNIHQNKQPQTRLIGNQEVNVGEYLYYEAQRKKEENLDLIQRKKFQQLQETDENLTFHPQLTQKSIRLAEQRKQQQLLPEDRFELDRRIQSEKKEKLRNQVRNELVQDCTFHPKVNNISEKIIKEKHKHQQTEKTSNFERLYNEAQERQIKNQQKILQKAFEEQSQKQSFMNRPPLVDNNVPFLERMERNVKQKQEKQQFIEQQQSQMLNEKDMQECQFQPQTGRHPEFERNQQGLPIGDYLYKYSEAQQKYQEYKLQKQIEQEQSLFHRTSSNSNQILDEKRNKILEQIFDQLDSDGDGQISSSQMNISNLDQETLRIFTDFFTQMEQQSIIFNLQDFQFAAYHYLNSLSLDDKNKILNNQKSKWEKKKENLKENYSHKPQVDEKSQHIVQKKKKQLGQKDLYTNGLEILKNKQEKIKKQKEQIQKEENGQCTFKPILYKPIGIYSFSKITPSKPLNTISQSSSTKNLQTQQNNFINNFSQQKQQQLIDANQENLKQFQSDENMVLNDQNNNIQPQFFQI